ncbi:MAG: rRNA maturation RNase YbeY [Caldilineae bacterium]|nr:MAG: rRNA maturation RNase YbeY [Caldilineae bacterium]
MQSDAWTLSVEIDEPFATKVDPALLTRAARAALAWAGVGRASLAIVVTDDEQVRALNRDYRGVDAATDVLSFAAQEGDSLPGVLPPELAAELQENLGDIFIAYPYASTQAERYGHSMAAELQLLVVHGCLHLLGYDHDTPARQAEMWAAQAAILAPLVAEDLSRRIHGEG